jgi:hypothetical protein
MVTSRALVTRLPSPEFLYPSIILTTPFFIHESCCVAGFGIFYAPPGPLGISWISCGNHGLVVIRFLYEGKDPKVQASYQSVSCHVSPSTDLLSLGKFLSAEKTTPTFLRCSDDPMVSLRSFLALFVLKGNAGSSRFTSPIFLQTSET